MNVTNNQKRFNSLLTLINDTNPVIVAKSTEALVESIHDWEPYFKDESIELNPRQIAIVNPLLKDYAVKIIVAEWDALVHQDQFKLELKTGLELISLLNNPELEKGFLDVKLKALEKEFLDFLSIRGNRLDAPKLELANNLCHYLGQIEKFAGNSDEFYCSENSFLENVIEYKKGTPMAICSLYILMAQQINLNLYGLGLPGHFIVGLTHENNQYFFDPFNGGKSLTKASCIKNIKRFGERPRDFFFKPLSAEKYLFKVVQNICKGFAFLNKFEKKKQFDRFLKSIQQARFNYIGSRRGNI